MNKLRMVLVGIIVSGLFVGFMPSKPSLDLQYLQDCTVQVLCADGGWGSGVFIGPDIVVTAAHVADGEPNRVLLNDRTILNIIEISISENCDVAILRVEGTHDFVPLGGEVALGDLVYHIGTPLEKEFFNCLFKGIVCQTNVDWYIWSDGFIMDAWSAHGCSGGPVFNEKGELVGLLVGGSAYGSGICETLEHIKQTLLECEVVLQK